MDMKENEKWGARIERGTIDEADGNRYKVKSLSRDNVKTPWIGPAAIEPTLYVLNEDGTRGPDVKYEPTEYKPGDMVYFFMFSDGHGAILGKAQ